MKPRPLLPFLGSCLIFAASASAQTFTWTNPAGGSFVTSTNWDTAPVFSPDAVLDFSTLDITATAPLTLDGDATAATLKFADQPTATNDWTLATGTSGLLTLQSNSGQPVIDVTNRAATISAMINGTQGFNKSGAGTLVLNNANNPIVGTSIISAGVLQITDGSTNTGGFLTPGSLGVSSIYASPGATLDLPRTHASQAQSVVWTLPQIFADAGSKLRFRASTGTSNHTLAAPITLSGSGSPFTIENNGGGYGQDITLSGQLAGTGDISYLATTSSGNVNGQDRTLTLSGTTTSFSGNWFVDYTVASDDFAVLKSGAPGAIGTGNVTLDDRAKLVNGVAGGIDSINAVIVQQATSSVELGSGWTNPAALLDLQAGSVSLGSATAFGTANISTLTQGATSVVRLDVGDSPANADRINLSGNYEVNEGGSIVVNLLDRPDAATYDLVTYAGTRTGTPAISVTPANRYTPVINTGSGTNDKVSLTFSGDAVTLKWKGDDVTNPNNWDINTTANWSNNGSPDKFLAFDDVLFDDTAASFAPALAVQVVPHSVVFNNSTNAYTLSGAGGITGKTTLVKNGAGSATIATANTYLGETIINAGKLVLGNIGALGANGNKTVTVNTGGQFDFAGISPGTGRTYTYRIQGDGDGTGAIVNSSATSVGSNSGILNLELLGDASLGGTGRFDVARTTTNGVVTGNGHTLTKIGANDVALRGDASGTPIHIVANGGKLWIEDTDLAYGGATGTLTINNGARAGTYGARTLATPVTINDGGILYNQGNNTGTWSGGITLNGTGTIETNTAIVVNSAIGETGGARKLVKTGTNTLTLSSPANTYTGGTDVSLGNLRGTGDNPFSSGMVSVIGATTAQTRVELSGATVDNDFTLNSAGQTAFQGAITALGGTTSVVNGAVTVAKGVGNGGHFAAIDAGTLLRLNGPIHVANGATPNIRSGTVEVAGGGTYPTLDQGEGTIRLGADNGINPAARLRLAISNPGTFDLNGYQQTLSELLRAATAVATTLNNSATPSVLTVNYSGATASTYNGVLAAGTGELGLTKAGSGTLVLTGANTYTGATTIDAGRLEIGSGGTAGTLGTSYVLNNGVLAFNRSNALSVPNQILGSGSIVKSGTGTTTLSGTNSYSGDTTVSAGTLDLVNPNPSEDGDIRITTGAKLQLTFTDVDTVDQLYIDNVAQVPGLWGPVGSTTATHTSPLITGNGLLLVKNGPDDSPYATWVTDRGLTPGVNDGFDQDPDHDGVNNLGEFAFDGNPLSGSASGKTLGISGTVGTDGNVFTLTIPVRNDAIFTPGATELVSRAVDGVIYRIQGSDNLTDWNLQITEVTGTDAATIQANLTETLSEGWSYRTFRTPGTMTDGDPADFIRAKVEKATP